jgi:hypothetical protein
LHKPFERELNSYAMHGWRIKKNAETYLPLPEPT